MMAIKFPICPKPKKGSDFLKEIEGLPKHEVEKRIYRELLRGNVPDFMRKEFFKPIKVTGRIDGETVEFELMVCIDYVAIGTKNDYVRVPMSPLMARRLGDRFGFVLPTSRMVDIIAAKAKSNKAYLDFVAAPEVAKRVTDPDTKRPVWDKWVKPKPGMKRDEIKYGAYEGKWMVKPSFFGEQSEMLDEQIEAKNIGLVIREGGKKNVILHENLLGREGSGKVAIYHPNRSIQDANLPHWNIYWDYSHGIRMVMDKKYEITFTRANKTKYTKKMTIAEILMDRKLYQLLGDRRMDIRKMYTKPVPLVFPKKTGLVLPPETRQGRRKRPPLQKLT